MDDIKIVCSNPWCKAHFTYPVNDDELYPSVCNKCESFDKLLSNGVTWETKQYEGSRMDGMPHSFRYKINKFY